MSERNDEGGFLTEPRAESGERPRPHSGAPAPRSAPPRNGGRGITDDLFIDHAPSTGAPPLDPATFVDSRARPRGSPGGAPPPGPAGLDKRAAPAGGPRPTAPAARKDRATLAPQFEDEATLRVSDPAEGGADWFTLGVLTEDAKAPASQAAAPERYAAESRSPPPASGIASDVMLDELGAMRVVPGGQAAAGFEFLDGDSTLEDSLAAIAAQALEGLPDELVSNESQAAVRQAAPAAAAHRPAPLEVALPASLVLVDDDLGAAAQLAARLLEKGYACRIARSEQGARAIEEMRPDLVLLDVPPEEARADSGSARLAQLAAPGLPVFVVSSATFPPAAEAAGPPIAARITKPYLIDDLVQAIEAARRKWGAPPNRGAPGGLRSDDRTPRGTTEDLPGDKVIRALISTGPEGETIRGRVRSISEAGVLAIEATTRLVAKKSLSAELKLGDGRTWLLAGKVGRVDRDQVVLELDVAEGHKELMRRFVEDMRTPGRAIAPVRIRVEDEFAGEVVDDAVLERKWEELQANLDDDGAHQRFIQDCIRAERLELAIQRYRDLKAQRPDDARVAKYLLQIGTILSFKAFSKKDDPTTKSRMPRSVVFLVAALALAMLALLAGLFAMRH